MLLPQEPRLYCLFFNGLVVEYQTDLEENNSLASSESLILTSQMSQSSAQQQMQAKQSVQSIEREAVILKEIHYFNQRSLNEKGVFMLECGNEAFVWIGKKVQEKDRLYSY